MWGWIVLGILLGLVLILFTIGISIYNRLVVLRNHADEAFSTMDVYLKKRFDLVPNLVEVTKGYAKHEKETLENVTKARTSVMNADNAQERLKAEGQLTQSLKTLFAVAENYPALKADSNFLELNKSLNGMEKEIADSRRYYNGTVKAYNTRREVFPSSIIASMFAFEKKALFELDSVEERKNVKVSFSN